jgi:hypothetical protein
MSPFTTIVITDPDLLAKLVAADGMILFQGPNGPPVKVVNTLRGEKLPPGFKAPFTEEELKLRSQDRTGRPIGDVIKELKEKYGE